MSVLNPIEDALKSAEARFLHLAKVAGLRLDAQLALAALVTEDPDRADGYRAALKDMGC